MDPLNFFRAREKKTETFRLFSLHLPIRERFVNSEKTRFFFEAIAERRIPIVLEFAVEQLGNHVITLIGVPYAQEKTLGAIVRNLWPAAEINPAAINPLSSAAVVAGASLIETAVASHPALFLTFMNQLAKIEWIGEGIVLQLVAKPQNRTEFSVSLRIAAGAGTMFRARELVSSLAVAADGMRVKMTAHPKFFRELTHASFNAKSSFRASPASLAARFYV